MPNSTGEMSPVEQQARVNFLVCRAGYQQLTKEGDPRAAVAKEQMDYWSDRLRRLND